jgi:hypothetical protein
MRTGASAGKSGLSELKMNIWPRTDRRGCDELDSDEGVDGVALRTALSLGFSGPHVQQAQSSQSIERAPELSTTQQRSDI